MKELDLKEIRQEIDAVDGQLTELFERRMNLVDSVNQYKRARGLPVQNRQRELEVLDRCTAMLKDPAFASGCRRMMEKIMEISRDYQHAKERDGIKSAVPVPTPEGVLKVGYQGVPGSFSHQAVQDFFAGREYNAEHFSLFEDVVKAVVDGQISCGILPIENSSTGGIADVYDLLGRYDCQIVGEKCVKVDQNLLVLPDATIEDIQEVYSHPQGFSQSTAFFREHPDWKLIPYFNTARSAEMVSQQGDPKKAAVASLQAARLYGLKVLVEKINFNSSNTTRFVVIARESWADHGADKITVIVRLAHEPGSLHRALGCFSDNGLNLTNLESRPLEGRSWEYNFYMDFSGNLRESGVEQAMESLRTCSTYLKVLGNYRCDR